MAALATEQHGVVTFQQMIDIGVSASAIHRAAADGFLAGLHRGVFAFGHARLRIEGRWMAAVLAAGPRAAISHADGLILRGVVRVSGTRIHVTVPRLTGGAHRRDGVVVHRCKLDARDLDVVDGIPTTTLARALLDYAEQARGDRLDRALEAAEKQGVLDLDAVLELLERTRGRRGLKRLRRAVEIYVPEPRRVNSWLERQTLPLIRKANLPMPQVNLGLNGHEVDLQWPEHRLVVELDSREHHDTTLAYENDRSRDAVHVAGGYSVMRFTHRRLTREPDAVIAELRDALAIRDPGRPAA